MLKPRFFAAALLVAALLPQPPLALGAPDADATPSPSSKAKASPSSSRASKSPTPAPKASAKSSPKSSPKPSPRSSPKPKSSSSNDDAAAPKSSPKASAAKTRSKGSTKGASKKKSTAKPKPAARKRTPSQDAGDAPRPRQQEPKKPAPEEPKPTPEPTPRRAPVPAPARPREGAAAKPAATPATEGTVVVSKSGAVEEEEATPPPQEEKTSWWWPFGHAHRYKYLSRSVRDAIDRAPVPSHQWRYIVVHNSGTRQGNAKAFDYYHRYVRKMPNGLAYHFVIGNGTSSGNGQIEVGSRWIRQINGGHVHSDYLNSIALGICLVGDYNRDKPTKEQLEALDELIQYLRKKVGKTDHHYAVVKPHRDINPPQWPTDCPGDRFPYGWLQSEFGQ